MSPVLHFDVIAIIIDIIGETKDTKLLKELALVSHSFLQICRIHLFATVKLPNTVPSLTSPKRQFTRLLRNNSDIVGYIRELTFQASVYEDNEDLPLSPILSNCFLPTVSRLNCLKISAEYLDWLKMEPCLTSAFLHLMHLPTINHIDLSNIRNFPLSNLTLSVNLLRLDMHYLKCSEYFDENLQSVTMPNIPIIREFHTSVSTMLTTKLLHAKRQDGQPAFNFMDLRRVSMSLDDIEDQRNIRYLLQNAKLLEKLHLKVDFGSSLMGVLSLSSCTLKVLDLGVFLNDPRTGSLAGLCGELEAMAGHNLLEALSLEVHTRSVYDTVDFIGSRIQQVEKVLAKPGWSALRQVSFKLIISRWMFAAEPTEALVVALQSLPDKYLNHLPKLESVAFHYSADLA